MTLSVELSEDLLREANAVLEPSYLDVPAAIGIFLRRVVKEQSISFLFPAKGGEKESVKASHESLNDDSREDFGNDPEAFSMYGGSESGGATHYAMRRDMTKSRAIRLLLSKGYQLTSSITFASKNRGAYNYWANPEFSLLQSNWSLILNDWVAKKLYLFTIPANSIKPSELTPRSDKGYLIDLQVMYRDSTFTDNRSGFSFAKFLTAEVDY